MESCLYEGTIRHRRHRPVINAFAYRLFFVYLDLAEADQAFATHPLWSVGRVNAAYLRRRDHYGDPAISIDETIRQKVAAVTGVRPAGPIRMLTHFRYFGYCFNPATFYFCYAPGAASPETIVVEIHNTPWLERHLYVLPVSENRHPSPEWRQFFLKKTFHVSPFLDMAIDYDWRFRVPGQQLAVHMIARRDGDTMFDASLQLQRRAINRTELTRVLIRHPLMTAKVTAMIYWQALKLHLKGTPFYTHPDKQ